MTAVIATGDMPIEDFWFRKDELPGDGVNLVYCFCGRSRTDPTAKAVLFYVGSTSNFKNRLPSHKRWLFGLHKDYRLAVSWYVVKTRRDAYRLEADTQMAWYGTAGCQKQLEKYGVRHLYAMRGRHA